LCRGDPRKYLRCAWCHLVLLVGCHLGLIRSTFYLLQTVTRLPEIACKNLGDKVPVGLNNLEGK
jgi:hypothetical protein